MVEGCKGETSCARVSAALAYSDAGGDRVNGTEKI